MTQGSPRRLAAILAADVVGYSRLVESDEEGTVQALRSHRAEIIDPLLRDHSGRVANTAGDSLLLEFASAVDAIRFAIALQRKMAAANADANPDKRIEFRIGLNVGDVLVENEDLLGDGVNVAARLETLADPGGICLSRSAHDQIIGKLDMALEPLGEVQVKNISRPVEAYKVRLDGEPVAKTFAPRRASPTKPLVATVILAALAVGGYAIWNNSALDFEPAREDAMTHALPDKPSIVVLPFGDRAADGGQGDFADGVTEDLITDLSKISSVFVIASNTSFAYKGQDFTIKSVAEDLGVRYVIDGSVRRSGDTLRINAQLVDALSGQQVWADRFDGAAENVFDVQDLVVKNIVQALELTLTESEQSAIAKPDTKELAAREAFQRGWELYSRFNEGDNRFAIEFFKEAIEHDPDYGRAYVALALVYQRGGAFRWDVGVPGARVTIFKTVVPELLEKAQALGESNLVHIIAAMRYLNFANQMTGISGSRRSEMARVEAARAIELAPNDPESHITMAWALIVGGRPEESLDFVETAKRLNPNSPNHYVMLEAAAHYGLGDLSKAADVLSARLDQGAGSSALAPMAASIYAQLGNRVEANFIIGNWRGWNAARSVTDTYFFPIQWDDAHQRLNEGMSDGLRLSVLDPGISVTAIAAEIDGQGPSNKVKSIRTLGWFGPRADPAVPKLIELLGDESRRVQREAAITLGKIGPAAKAALPRLEELREQPLIGLHARNAITGISAE
jgi:TolB-like protein/class 3 adenylate cyclase